MPIVPSLPGLKYNTAGTTGSLYLFTFPVLSHFSFPVPPHWPECSVQHCKVQTHDPQRWLLSFQALTLPREEQKQKLPFQMCSEGRRGSHSVPRGQNCALNFKGGCLRGPTRLTPQKCLMNYHGRHQLCRLMTKRSLVYVSVEEDKFSLGFENLRD